jgi:D-hydroxyproline dehydrogenase subunit gamma
MPERVTIRVDGRALDVPAGSSVAAALWNAGVARLGSSLAGAPRGALCAMGVCFECRVTIDGVAHRRACLEPCAAGMEIVTSG